MSDRDPPDADDLYDDDDVDYEADAALSPDEVDSFVAAYVYPWVAPKVAAGTGLWCPLWADHPPVLVRITELAVSRGAAVVEAHLPARWWVDVLDRHVERIVALDGPFRECAAGHERDPTPPMFADVDGWFDGWFSMVLTRRDSELFWCPGWAEHPEVYLQLMACWALWEKARAHPAAMGAWWDHAHRTLTAVTRDGGPFAMCKQRRGHAPEWKTITGRRVVARLDGSGHPRTDLTP